jgi:hypothetical protein
MDVQIKNKATKPFVKNSKVPFTLELGNKIRRGCVIVKGAIVVSGGTTSGVAQGEGGMINLIKRITVVATPSANSRYPGGNIVDATPRSLLRYAINQHSGKFIGSLGDAVTGAAGTFNVYLSIPIYWQDSNLRLPGMNIAALNTDPGVYDSVQVQIDTGDLAACFTGNDRAVDYSGLDVQWYDDRIEMPGVDTVVRYQEDHEFLIAATRDRALDEAMPRDGMFESWLIMGQLNAAAALSDALLTKVRIDGPTLGLELWSDDIRQRMLDDEWLDPDETATGLYFLDFTDGSAGNTVDARYLATTFDIKNASGANLDSFLIFTRRLVAPVKAR